MSEEHGMIREYLGPAFPDVEVVDLETVLGTPMLVKDYRLRKGKFGTFAVILAQVADGDLVFITGSQVVLDQLDQLQTKLPLWGVIRKEKNYYTLE